MWEYILALRKNATSGVCGQEYYTLPELVNQYNNKTNSGFEATGNSYLHCNTGSCYIKTLDGMCGVMIIHKTAIHSTDFKNWLPLLQFLAEAGNYTKMMVTNVQGGKLEAWKALGFKTVSAFTNKRTHNNVEILMKDV